MFCMCIPYFLCGSPNEWRDIYLCNTYVITTWRLELQAPLVACDYPLYKIQTCQYNILANSFWVKLIKHEIFALLWQEFLKTSQLLPHISNNFPRTSKLFQKMCEVVLTTIEHSEVISSVKGKLNCIFVINHVLKNNLSGFVCQVREIVLVNEWNQGLEISPQAWNSCIMC